LTAWLFAIALVLILFRLGTHVWRSRLAPEPPEELEHLRLWLEEWMLVDDIVSAAYSVKTASPEGIRDTRLKLGGMDEPMLRCAVAAFLQHRTVRREVAKYMSWRYVLPRAKCMKRLQELSEIARA